MILRALAVIVMVTLGTLALPLRAGTQPTAKAARIGVLIPSTPAATTHLVEAFKQGLAEHGYVEGQHFILERRYGEARIDRLADLATELVRLQVDVIVTGTDLGVPAAKQHTQTIPIVMANSIDPVRTGFVASLARPGGNVTGLTLISSELSGKRSELLREAVPTLSRVAFLCNPDVAGAPLGYREAETAARRLGLDIRSIEVRRIDALDGALNVGQGP